MLNFFCYGPILAKTSSSFNKKPIFSPLFGGNVFKIITSLPWLIISWPRCNQFHYVKKFTCLHVVEAKTGRIFTEFSPTRQSVATDLPEKRRCRFSSASRPASWTWSKRSGVGECCVSGKPRSDSGEPASTSLQENAIWNDFVYSFSKLKSFLSCSNQEHG
jgi:hypothetical protein